MQAMSRTGIAGTASLVILLAAACAGRSGDDNPVPPTPPATPSANAQLPASLASAKGWLAYSTFVGAHDRIHLARIDGSQEHEVAPDLPGDVIRADFSHDGRLAFQYRPPDDAYNVYVANADGTNPHVVARCKLDVCERDFPAWSPDGKHLATHTAIGKPQSVGGPPEFAIGVIDVATQHVRLILRHPSHQFQEQLIRWSPDGRKLVFYRWRPAKGQSVESPDAESAVFTVNIDGTHLKQLTPWNMRCGDPDWSPDGKTIICTTHPPGDFDTAEGDIYALNPDGSAPRPLTSYGSTGPRAGHARFTPDGTTILYIRSASQDWKSPPRHMYALDLATGRQIPVLTARAVYTRPTLQSDPQH